MSTSRVLLESVRSVSRDGREFVLFYSLAIRDTNRGPEPYIQASLKEKAGNGDHREAEYTVEMSLIEPEVMKRIFETIASARDPVFPVHVPEIVRDQLSSEISGSARWPR